MSYLEYKISQLQRLVENHVDPEPLIADMAGVPSLIEYLDVIDISVQREDVEIIRYDMSTPYHILVGSKTFTNEKRKLLCELLLTIHLVGEDSMNEFFYNILETIEEIIEPSGLRREDLLRAVNYLPKITNSIGSAILGWQGNTSFILVVSIKEVNNGLL